MVRVQKGKPAFDGFARPTQNYFRVPNEWIDISAGIKNISELKVVQYILRHTWGYQEFGIAKRITIDEFIAGRKRRDGSRIDSGTGLAEQSVRNGLAAALDDGLIEEFIDDSDRARVKKYYSLRMRPEPGADDHVPADDETEKIHLGGGVQTLDPGPQSLDLWGPTVRPRTEKDTLERNLEERHLINSNEKQTGDLHKTGSDLRSIALRQENVDNSAVGDADRFPEPPSAPTGWSSTGQILSRTQPRRGAADGPSNGAVRGRPPKAPPYIAAVMGDISGRLHDDTPRSSLTRATRLWKASGLPEERFVQEVLYPARSRTQQQGGVTKRASAGDGTINRIPYFFAVVEDVLGLKDAAADPS